MLILTRHARQRMTLRAIDEAWVQTTIDQPEHTELDVHDPAVINAWRRIPERGDRFLRVVFRRSGGDIVVVTAVFDRRASRRWQP